ncbi:MAG: sugar O-acetyltransferase [Oscillospiraceae bacterium]|nr:sugar O-acetyltransferase [Oscillospiraceae bacterium]
MTNTERRDREMAYITDADVLDEQKKCRRILQKLNFIDRSDFEGIAEIIAELLNAEEGVFINPPFYCDYGKHIYVGKNFFANYNCTIIDVAPVIFGDNCMLGPNVAVYTAGHPIHPDTRSSLYEYGKKVTFGDNVWIGGNAVICPGVHVGSNVVIGAGSVVTKDIPDWCVAAGNPCRVLQKITDKDRKKLFHDEEIDPEAWEEIVNRGLADQSHPKDQLK